jgi:hypothetical protein
MAMNTPLRSHSFGSLLAAGGIMLAAFAWSLPGAALAQSAAPSAPPVLSLQAKKVSGNFDVAADHAAQQNSGGKKGKGGGGASDTTSATTKAWVEITVRNSGDGPANAVVVNYTVYVRTVNSGGGSSGISWSKTDGSETIDNIDPDKADVVLTTPMDKSSSISQSVSSGGGGGKKGGGGGSVSGTASMTDIYGWHIEIVLDGQVVAKNENPTGIKAQVDKSLGQ